MKNYQLKNLEIALFYYNGLKIKEIYAFQLMDQFFNRKPMN